jgi:hypothetical protein
MKYQNGAAKTVKSAIRKWGVSQWVELSTFHFIHSKQKPPSILQKKIILINRAKFPNFKPQTDAQVPITAVK